MAAMEALRAGNAEVSRGSSMTSRAIVGKPARRTRGGCSAVALLAAACCIACLAPAARAASVYEVHTGEKDTTTLALRGQIVPGDLARLQRETAKIAADRRIVLLLESPGGNIDEGISIGRYVYASKIATVAIQGPGCHSSCSFVFLAGRDKASDAPLRIMIKGARIGFHQGALGNIAQDKTYSAAAVEYATAAGQEIVKQINAYFNEIKADPEFLTLTLSAPNKSITLLNEFDALRLGIYVMDPATQRLTTPADFKR